MKLPKALLGAMLVGMTAQLATSCTTGETPKPKEESGKKSTKITPDNCPGCGMG